MYANSTTIILFFCWFLSACLSGCTLIGFGIGAVVDSNAKHDLVPIFSDIENNSGKKARILYGDSSCTATFLWYSDETEDHYRRDYENFVKLHSSNPAAITFGDTIITGKSGSTGVFTGYYPEGILLSGKEYSLSKFDNIIAPKFTSKDILVKQFELNNIPIRGLLSFRDNFDNKFYLTNRDFRNVFIKSGNPSWKWIGLGVGALLDAAFVIWIGYYNSPAHGGNGSFAKIHYSGSLP